MVDKEIKSWIKDSDGSVTEADPTRKEFYSTNITRCNFYEMFSDLFVMQEKTIGKVFSYLSGDNSDGTFYFFLNIGRLDYENGSINAASSIRLGKGGPGHKLKIHIDSDGNTFACIYSSTTESLMIGKYDSEGNKLGEFSESNAVKDANDSHLSCSLLLTHVGFDNDNNIYYPVQTTYVKKLDSDLNVVWTKDFSEDYVDFGRDKASVGCPAKVLFLPHPDGGFATKTYYDGAKKTLDGIEAYSHAIRYDANGTRLWAKQYGYSGVKAFINTVDKDGLILVDSGNFEPPINIIYIDPNTGETVDTLEYWEMESPVDAADSLDGSFPTARLPDKSGNVLAEFSHPNYSSNYLFLIDKSANPDFGDALGYLFSYSDMFLVLIDEEERICMIKEGYLSFLDYAGSTLKSISYSGMPILDIQGSL